MDDCDYYRLVHVKETLGLTWVQLIKKGAENLGVTAQVPVTGTLLKGVEATIPLTAPAPTKISQGGKPG